MGECFGGGADINLAKSGTATIIGQAGQHTILPQRLVARLPVSDRMLAFSANRARPARLKECFHDDGLDRDVRPRLGNEALGLTFSDSFHSYYQVSAGLRGSLQRQHANAPKRKAAGCVTRIR